MIWQNGARFSRFVVFANTILFSKPTKGSLQTFAARCSDDRFGLKAALRHEGHERQEMTAPHFSFIRARLAKPASVRAELREIGRDGGVISSRANSAR